MAKQHGLIFDVDGVIADTERVNAEASILVFAKLFGIKDIVRADFEAGLGRGAAEYIRSAARVHGIDLSDQQVEAAAKERQTRFLEMLAEKPLPAFPGVVELMDAALARTDFCVGIATSSTREKSEAVLQSARIPYARMAYITGSDVTKKKPDPELFLKAAALLSLAPEHCVVIEDAPEGVAAAKAAGCRCVAVTNSTVREKLSEADVVVESLDEVDVLFVAGLIDEIGGVE